MMICTESRCPCANMVHFPTQIATRTWGGILAHLQLTAADHQRDVFVKEQWAETVEALQGYYARYLVPRKDTATGFPAEAVPVVDGRDGLDGVSTRVTAGAPVKGNCPTADPGEVTPRTQTPSRDTSSDAFRGRSASTVVPLVDPSTCKNTPPRTKVKIEEGVVGSFFAQRRLSQIHIELLFPHINGSLVCGPCMIDQVDYKREYPTPFHELLAHVEAQHPDAVADILNQTVGMNSDQLHEWFAALDADE
ncbi:hypothetical protein B0H17DRAFT_258034 [Mycena rosella]|uniref:Uncharacterized protein n=1 Tax=Mycena rosella TaxID=1033263 RepID=A0AAD7G502_MYCRO|nr:hypothetical protein B0H17DRAFT_258034 [Mycena rosella]